MAAAPNVAFRSRVRSVKPVRKTTPWLHFSRTGKGPRSPSGRGANREDEGTTGRLCGHRGDLYSARRRPCQGHTPRYQSCTPPAGVLGLSAQPWTDASNQIIAGLFLARQVTDHFATLDDIQTKLFLDQNSEFPSIAADLRIAQAGEQSVVASVDYMDVFGVIVGILAAIPAPGFQAGAAAIQTALALGEALTPTLTGEEPNQLDQTFAQMRRHVAKLQQQTRTRSPPSDARCWGTTVSSPPSVDSSLRTSGSSTGRPR